MEHDTGHLRCPYCRAYSVDRLFVGTVHLDSCECGTCGARWDEVPDEGTFRGRACRTSVLAPRDRR